MIVKLPITGSWALIAMLAVLSACRIQPASSWRSQEAKNLIAGLTNDSALLDAMVYTAYQEVLVPLYYDACKTDERTDNLYNSLGRAAVDTGYAREWDQMDKIKLCNQLQKVIGQNGNINRPCRLQWLAELDFLKAMVYYAMVQRYGGFVMDAAAGETSHFFYPTEKRASLSATYRFTMDAFQRSILHLPEERNTLRANKTAAQAMVLRVALQAAACIPEERTAYLALAMKAGEEVLAKDGYSLDPDYEGLFNSFNSSRNSREVILGICRPRAYTTFQQTLMQDLVVNQSNEKMREGYGPSLQDNFEGWSKRYPTQDLVDAYLAMDSDRTAKKWDETNRYKAFRAGKDDAVAVLYTDRDKRFYTSIVYDSSKYFNSIVFTRDSGNLSTHARRDNNAITPTGYYVRKLLYESKKVWYTDGTDHFLPMLRLGEVYLNLAEACWLMGYRQRAISFMNKTRTLHGALPPLDTAALLPVVWVAYKNERRVEMFFENDRYWSLLRWALFSGQRGIMELDKNADAVKISADGKSFRINQVPDAGGGTGRRLVGRFLSPLPPEAKKLH